MVLIVYVNLLPSIGGVMSFETVLNFTGLVFLNASSIQWLDDLPFSLSSCVLSRINGRSRIYYWLTVWTVLCSIDWHNVVQYWLCSHVVQYWSSAAVHTRWGSNGTCTHSLHIHCTFTTHSLTVVLLVYILCLLPLHLNFGRHSRCGTASVITWRCFYSLKFCSLQIVFFLFFLF